MIACGPLYTVGFMLIFSRFLFCVLDIIYILLIIFYNAIGGIFCLNILSGSLQLSENLSLCKLISFMGHFILAEIHRALQYFKLILSSCGHWL